MTRHDKTTHNHSDHQDDASMAHSKDMDHMNHHMDHADDHMMDHSMHMGNLKQKFFVSLILAIPIILFSPMMGLDLPFQITFPGSDWVVLVLATALFFYGGMPFFKGAKMELSMKNPAMMTLISLGISVAYLYSLYAFIMNTFFHDTHVMDFFWELATLIVIMLLGHWIEMNAISNAGNALEKMAALLPKTAKLVGDDGSTSEVQLSDVTVGQKLLVQAGEKIPTDGKIVEGNSSVNEAMVTGESKEVEKNTGDDVIGGSVNGNGTLTISVTGTGESGYLSQVMALVSKAQQDKSSVETLSDRVAKWLFYIALIVGILAFIVWLSLTGDIGIALERMVTVLIIACPHALGLAIPLVTAKSTSLGAKNGLLIKNRQAIEVARHIDVVMMDKTGTLTEGNFAVNDIISYSDDYDQQKILAYIASLEQNSSHPLARGIITKATEEKVELPLATEVENIPGTGLEGTIDSQDVKIVNVSYLKDHTIDYNDTDFTHLSEKGNSISYLLVDQQPIGLIAQGDQIKSGAKRMITALKTKGIRPVMLTGDNEAVANLVATELGIDDVHASLKPEDKETIIKRYKSEGKTVMMVGDGVNDAPSLVRADIGVAIGAGTDVANDSADIILVKSDPADILHFLTLAKNTQRKMIQNLWWGAGYNIITIPLAAGVLANWGIILSPAVGAILMSLSTVIVALNAMLLKMDD